MITLILRCLIIYIIALIVIRVMGKRQIAQMQPFELVITLIIADLATVPMSDVNIPLINGIVPLLVLAILHYVITLMSCKNIKCRSFFNGRSAILIGPNGINEKEIKEMNITINDVIEACRFAGYLNLDEIQYVIMETNGNISVIPNSNSTPTTREDLNIQKQDPELPLFLISDGKYSIENIKLMKLTKNDVDKFLTKHDTYIKDVIVMSYTKSGKIFLQTALQGKQTFNEVLTKVKEAEND